MNRQPVSRTPMISPDDGPAVHGALAAAFGQDRVQANAPLAPLTTFRVGGKADWLIEVRDAGEALAAIRLAARAGAPLTILGGGSNILIADQGIRGVVLRMRGGTIKQVDARRVKADAGVTINGLVRWTINRSLAGLEAWAGTPGTVGGAIRGNAHFQGRLIGELVASVGLVSGAGELAEAPAEQMAFGYDDSRVQHTGEAVLWSTFHVTPGEATSLRATARASLAYRKQTQPLESPSAGCIFRNPDPARQRLPSGVPASAGALIDLAGLKGRAIGGARVSPTHGNFIVNEGSATARDIRALIELCKQSVAERFGVELREEIVYIGEF